MSHERWIDELTKLIGSGASRRQVVGAALGWGTLAGAPFAGRSPRRTPRSFAQPAMRPTLVYFALGDSIASGHGLGDDGSACRRSGLAYPYKLLDGLRAQFRIRSLYHFSCSGATARRPKRMDDPYHWFANQVTEVERKLQTDIPPEQPVLITISIGANDFQWLSPSILSRLVEPDVLFTAWVADTCNAVAQAVRPLVQRLLDFPNVGIILTQYHNPVNRRSTIFEFTDRFLPVSCNSVFSRRTCYERTETAIHALNDALKEQVVEALDSRRVAITPNLHQAFHADGGHEGPGLAGIPVGPGLCGLAPPGVANTWVQHLGDPRSNSLDFLGGKLGLPRQGIFGDCFHPNEAGAQAFASAVAALVDGLGLDKVCLEDACCVAGQCEAVLSNEPNAVCNVSPACKVRCTTTGGVTCVNDGLLCSGPPCARDSDCRGAVCLQPSCCGGVSRCSPFCQED